MRFLSRFAFASILSFPGSVLWAQSSGGITGIVSDPSHAVVAGALVTLINEATGAKQTDQTDGGGVFTFVSLPAGKYDLEVMNSGFQNYRQTALMVNLGRSLQTDIVLAVAQQSQQVTVSESAANVQIDASDTQLGETISGQGMTEVPLNGRSYTDLLATQAGVTPAATNTPVNTAGGGSFGAIAPSGDLNAGQYSINGQRESANGFVLNGANVMESIASAAAIVPNLDSIAEFHTLTGNFDAQYGNFSGALIQVATKSGGNQFHGSAFEFFRNTDLDARGFFDPARAQFNQNQFGGTFGGPIQKDKVFFFADYQGSRTVEGLATGLIPVPSLQERDGNLKDQTNLFGDCASGPCSVNGAYLANQLSQKLGYRVSQGEAYYQAGCVSTAICVFPNAVIPQRAISGPAQQLLRYIPMPTSDSDEFSSTSYAERIGDSKGSGRLDANTRIGNLNAYYAADNYNLNNPFPVQQGGADVPGFNALSTGFAQLATIGATKTFGSDAVNEFHASYMRDANHLGQPEGGVGTSLAAQGFAPASAGGIVPLYPSTQGVETVVFNSFSFGTTPFNLLQVDQTYQLSDDFSRITGNHSFRFGASGHVDHVKQHINLISNGEFQFFGSQTGLDFADFLLGLPTSYQQSYTPQFDNRSKYVGFYVQDSWRVRPNLTLNYGLRWEWLPAWSIQENSSATFVPGVQSQLFPGAPRDYVFPGDQLANGSVIPSTIAPTPKDDFSPRVGLAYSPSWTSGILGKLTGSPGKTSIRASYGRFFTAIEGLTAAYQTGNPPYGLQYASSEAPTFSAPFIGALSGTQYSQPFPLAAPQLGVNRQHPDSNINWQLFTPITGAVGYYNQNRTPYSENYYFSLERQLTGSSLLSIGYIGTQAHHLITLLSNNPGNPALCLSLSKPESVATGTPTCGPFGESSTYVAANGQVINGTRQLLGNNFGSDSYFYNFGNSVYNAFQASYRYASHSLSLTANYTYGKSLDDGSNMQEQLYPYDYRLRRSLSSFDIRQNLVATFRYDLPFNKLLKTSNRLTQGWAVSGITRFTSGLPVTMLDNNDNSLVGTQNQGVNSIGIDEPNVLPGSLELNSNPRSGRSYFDTALFALQPLGMPGTSPRRFFYGPGMANWDLALLKTTKLTETQSLEFRMESFNTFNHVQFFGASTVNGNISSPTFGKIVSADSPRLIQLALKYRF